MNTIKLKDINILDIIKNNYNLLTIKELLQQINYDINNIYHNKFWNNIKDDIWIYIDNELILWLEYKDIKKGKELIIRLLQKHFKENEDYKILTNSEFDINNFCSPSEGGQNNSEEKQNKEEKRGAHNKQYITVSPDCFKELCMYIETKKSKEIKKYYIELEKIFRFYLEYQNQYKDKQLEEAKSKNLNLQDHINESNKKEFNELLYVIATDAYDKYNNYKIGRSNNLKNRKVNYNTGKNDKDEYDFIYSIKTHNAAFLEQIIKNILIKFRPNVKKELYILKKELLIPIVDTICKNYNNMIEKYNELIIFNNKENMVTDIITTDILNNINNQELLQIEEEKKQTPIIPEDNKLKQVLELFEYKDNDNYKIISSETIINGFNNYFKQYVNENQYNKLKEINQYFNKLLLEYQYKIKRKRIKDKGTHFYLKYDETIKKTVKEIKPITDIEIQNKEIQLNSNNNLIIDNIDDKLKQILKIFKYDNEVNKINIVSNQEIVDGFNEYFKQYVNKGQYNKLKEMNQYLNSLLKNYKLKIDRTRIRKNKKTNYYFYIKNI